MVLIRYYFGYIESVCRMVVGFGEMYIMWYLEEIII